MSNIVTMPAEEVRDLRDELREANALNEINKIRLISSYASCEAGDRLLDKAERTITRLHARVEMSEYRADHAEKLLEVFEGFPTYSGMAENIMDLSEQVKQLKVQLSDAEEKNTTILNKNEVLASDNRKLKKEVWDLVAQRGDDSDDEFHTPASVPGSFDAGILNTPTSGSIHATGPGRNVQNKGPPPVFRLPTPGASVAKQQNAEDGDTLPVEDEENVKFSWSEHKRKCDT
ncbi:hypothetical protein ACHAQH_005657 [Verticillium albo-atrum]